MHVFLYTIYIPGAQGRQNNVSDLLDRELQVVPSHLMWILKTKLGYLTEAVPLRQVSITQMSLYSR